MKRVTKGEAKSVAEVGALSKQRITGCTVLSLADYKEKCTDTTIVRLRERAVEQAVNNSRKRSW